MSFVLSVQSGILFFRLGECEISYEPAKKEDDDFKAEIKRVFGTIGIKLKEKQTLYVEFEQNIVFAYDTKMDIFQIVSATDSRKPKRMIGSVLSAKLTEKERESLAESFSTLHQKYCDEITLELESSSF